MLFVFTAYSVVSALAAFSAFTLARRAGAVSRQAGLALRASGFAAAVYTAWPLINALVHVEAMQALEAQVSPVLLGGYFLGVAAAVFFLVTEAPVQPEVR